jgi:hypothetical protein
MALLRNSFLNKNIFEFIFIIDEETTSEIIFIYSYNNLEYYI